MGVSVESRTILNDLIQMQQEIVDCKEKEEAKTEKMKQLEEERRAKIPAVIKGGKEVYPLERLCEVS